MRPIKIEFQAFGPYVEHEIVDFNSISSKGLFLICGKTGTGKTTILDAMTFALFGKSSGHSRDDFKAMRCTKAPFETDTFVKFEFENNGEYYIFERRLERKRKNLSDVYSVLKKDSSGIWQPMFENPKASDLNKTAVEIIELDYDQFRQVIVLPQGQFEKLLTSNSDEKEKILSNIFGVEKWNRIAELMYVEAEARKKHLTESRDKIISRLEEEGCASIEELDDLIKNKNKHIELLNKSYADADYDQVIKTQQNALMLSKRFEDLQNAKGKVAELESRKDQKEAWVIELNNANRAELVRPVAKAYDEINNEVATRDNNLMDAKGALDSAKELSANATECLKKHIAKESAIEEKKVKKTQFESKKADYANLDKLKADFESCRVTVREATEAESKALEKVDSFEKEIQKLNAEYIALNNEHGLLLNSYIAGMSGELAEALSEGMPCPVCGSTSHPNKAVKSDSNATKEQVDKKKVEADSKYNELQDATGNMNLAKKYHEETNKKLADATKALALAKEKLESNAKNLVQGIDDLSALENSISILDLEIQKYASDKELLSKNAQIAEQKVVDANAKCEAAKKELAEAKTRFDQAKNELEDSISKSGFKDRNEAEQVSASEKKRAGLADNISKFEANLRSSKEAVEAIQLELKDAKEPNAEECERIIDEASMAKSAYEKECASVNTEIDRLSKKLKSIKAEGEGIEEKIIIAEEDFAFAKKLRGDAGTGLQRYVLGIMFSSVIDAANKMLEMVHGGRYRLFRSDDKVQGSNKRGLDLKVFDKYSEEHEGRFVSTLSGGEKFLASLALSIGMSTVAQKTGIKIDALFIDEGFGSLDEDCIADAMDILNSIQEANGIVGIISHVQLLQERIPTKLKIEVKDNSSHIVQTVG